MVSIVFYSSKLVQYIIAHAGIVIDKFQVHGTPPGTSAYRINLKGPKTAISSINVETSRSCYRPGELKGFL
jgi:hypothetical protein